MYQRESDSWTKHIDFTILDVICMQLALAVAYIFRNGLLNPFLRRDYYQMAFIFAVVDLLVVFFVESYKDIIERGYFAEFKQVLCHVSATIIGFTLFNFITKSSEQYSRLVVVLMWELSIILCYMARVKWKNHIRQRVLMEDGMRKSMIAIIDFASAENFVKRLRSHNLATGNLPE